MVENGVRRRDFLKWGGAPLAVASLVGCDVLATDPAGQNAEDDAERDGQEAPELARLAKSGDLPPVAERLPRDPPVIEPVERTGRYGGDWRMAMIGGPSTAALNSSVNYERLVRWHPTEFEVIPNVAEAVSQSEDGREYAFTLRAGLKWSDGKPFTADDILFWYEDVFLNDALTPVKDPWMITDGNPGVVEKVDERTVVFRFDPPNGILLRQLATGWAGAAGPTGCPRHYLTTFHQDHNPDGIDDLVEERGFDDWAALFLDRVDDWANPERPTLNAWKVVEGISENVSQVVAERNPYYWKVDPDGRQLPYLDRVIHEVVGNVDTAVLKTQNGEHMLTSEINTLANKPVFARGREQGGYRLIDTLSGDMNEAIIFLNLNHPDPVKAEIFNNLDFRIGLSHAINREEIIAVVYQRQGEPWQAAPMPDAGEFYHERLAKQYTEHDPDRANEYLDRAGYTDVDEDGFRLGPDGQRISFTVDIAVERKVEWVEVLDLVSGYWRDVGVEMRANSVADTLFWTRLEANEYDAEIWKGDGGLNVIMAPYYYFPFAYSSKFAPTWGYWFNGDSRGEEPPDRVKEQMELYNRVKVTRDPDEQLALMRQVLDIAAEQFYCIGTVLVPKGYQVVANEFRNVPDPLPYDWYHAWLARTNTCQYFTDA